MLPTFCRSGSKIKHAVAVKRMAFDFSSFLLLLSCKVKKRPTRDDGPRTWPKPPNH
jgi:hypothetical protein